MDHPIYLKRVGFLNLKPDLEQNFEHYKNLLRLVSRILQILIHTVDLYYIQKEIEQLSTQVNQLSKSKFEMDTNQQ